MKSEGSGVLKELQIGDLTAAIPVIQGGMGVGISLHRLAGTVAAEGGIGIISTAQIGFREEGFHEDPIGTNLKAIATELQKARELAAGGIVGVNIMVATRGYEDYVRAAVRAGADLIISGAGLPMNLPALTEGSRTKIAPIVSGRKAAEVIFKYWTKKYDRLPDLVVIEGPKAGGHLGFSADELERYLSGELDYDDEIRRIIAFVKERSKERQAESGQIGGGSAEIPVVVAGGVYTREDAEHMIALGADGVQMATRFVTTYECDAPDAYKQAYIHAEEPDITLVKSPVGMPGRAIRNAFLERTREGRIPHGKCHLCVSTCKPAETPYCITEALVNAAEGRVEDALLFAGSNAYRAKELEHVHDIMREFA